ncbi:hypothetical protein CDAR_284031 [Caerostris darwini]|uniref:Uncharacterized protein n=1 Tax=Caerostris darwini TaxID=1538125 RepID=A0AAV4PMG9_9ARAC|nr:hypothetical protein CDAR_284031 [Caerostris darwini]
MGFSFPNSNLYSDLQSANSDISTPSKILPRKRRLQKERSKSESITVLTEKGILQKPDWLRFGIGAITSPCRGVFARKAEEKGVLDDCQVLLKWIGRYILIKYLSLSPERSYRPSSLSVHFVWVPLPLFLPWIPW